MFGSLGMHQQRTASGSQHDGIEADQVPACSSSIDGNLCRCEDLVNLRGNRTGEAFMPRLVVERA